MASRAAPQAVADAPCVPRPIRIDPSRHLVPDDVPQSMLDNWKKMLDEAEARRLAQRAEFEAKVASAQKYATKLRGIVMNAYMMNHDIGALAYLFDKALIDDAEEDTDLLKASHLVVDVMKTIAARLGALEEQAALAHIEAGL